MKSLRNVVLSLSALFLLLGAAKAPDFMVRVFIEANEHDTERFASPIKLENPPRSAFIEKSPVISERNIRGIFPFQTLDGTWGCLLKLDDSGRIRLATVSVDKRNQALVVFAGTKKGTHQIIDMIIDRPVSDGIITIQRGLTELEVAALRKDFKTLSPKKETTPKP